MRLTAIDLVVMLGVGMVLPFSIGGPRRWWAAAAVAAFVSFLVRPGLAGLFALPFVVVCAAVALRELRAAGPLFWWRTSDAVRVVACGYAVVASLALVQSRFGADFIGVGEPIVELTAVHFMFAGSAALVLAGATQPGEDRFWRWAGAGALGFTAVAPPVVATGFVTGAAAAQVGGAVLMTAGVWLTATLQLRRAIVDRGIASSQRALLAVSGLAVWAPMVLAVAWAAGQHWDVPALSIAGMVHLHGVPNAIGFCVCGLLAHRLGAAAARATAVPG